MRAVVYILSSCLPPTHLSSLPPFHLIFQYFSKLFYFSSSSDIEYIRERQTLLANAMKGGEKKKGMKKWKERQERDSDRKEGKKD